MAGNFSDLLGDSSPTAPIAGASPSPGSGMFGAVSKAVDETSGVDEKELALVKQTWESYQTAREFDKQARIAFSKDRKYAAGKADPRWASDANLIGSFIDILVSFLYAQNPDLSVRPSEKVGMQPDKNASDFAETAELVTSNLWRHGRLKRCMKKKVRSILTTGQGWKKALMATQKTPHPQLERDILTQESLLAELQAQKRSLGSQINAPADSDAAEEAIKLTLQGLQAKEARNYCTGMSFDFIRSEDMQVSLDVASVTDYLDADWVSNDMYVLKSELQSKFPRLTDEDVKSAAVYYQRQAAAKDQNESTQYQQGDSIGEGTFTKTPPPSNQGGGKPVEFAKVVEMWRKCQGIVVTMVDGVKKWAAEPYPPPQATDRFYPYFLDALFEVDGERHPQSLVFRLFKLQDEYSACRSNQRLVRERSIPGLVFNRGAISPEDAKKFAESTVAENIGIDPTTKLDIPLQNLIIAKPLPSVNFELYDTKPILADMERISGVQEALQAAASAQPKTATEASIQQSGFASRTGADRDTLEDGLTDLANYSIQCAIQEVRPPQAQRIAGPQAFWPFGMDIQDILTLVEINVKAGSTGKPDQRQNAQNWSTILPMLEQLITKVRGLQITDPPLAAALENVVRETLHRLDDTLDISEFIPTEPPPPPPPPQPPPPQVKVNVDLQGQLPPGDVQPILEASGDIPPAGSPPGTPAPAAPAAVKAQTLPGGAPMPTLPGGVPMPPLQPKPDKGALKPGPAAPGAGTPK